MKKFLRIPLFVALVLLAAGCNKDTVLIKDMAGTWQVSQITYHLGTGDSLATGPDLGTFEFEACKWQKESDNQCPGAYRVGTGNRIPFGYNATAETNDMRIHITGEPRRGDYPSVSGYYEALQAYAGGNQPLLDTQWDITGRTDKAMTLSGTARIDHAGPQTIQSVKTTIKLTR